MINVVHNNVTGEVQKESRVERKTQNLSETTCRMTQCD